MPRYRLIERRAYEEAVLIEAESREAAMKYDGRIIDEAKTDSWGEELIRCEQVSDDRDYA